MSNRNIAQGILVAFDIFSKSDIEATNKKIEKILGLEPEIRKSAFFGKSPATTSTAIWAVKSPIDAMAIFRKVCAEKSYPVDMPLVEKLTKSCEVVGYDSPRLPYYVIMVRIQLNREPLNQDENLRTEVLQVASAASLFIENFSGGYRKTMSTFSPACPVVTQFWIKVKEEDFHQMREIELLINEQKDTQAFNQKKLLSENLRKLEPVELSCPTGDIHSHVLVAANLTYVVGHMNQIAMGGFLDPFIEYLTFDEALLQQDFFEQSLAPVELLIGGGILSSDYAHLVALISLLIYLEHLAFEREQLDVGIIKLGETISSKNHDNEIEERLLEISNLGTRLSSLEQSVGRFSRNWTGVLTNMSEGKDRLSIEVPVESDESFGMANIKKGYLGTLADQILSTMQSTMQLLEKQESELNSLRTNVSNIVSLRMSKSNEALQKQMKTLTVVSVVIALGSLVISLANWILSTI